MDPMEPQLAVPRDVLPAILVSQAEDIFFEPVELRMEPCWDDPTKLYVCLEVYGFRRPGGEEPLWPAHITIAYVRSAGGDAAGLQGRIRFALQRHIHTFEQTPIHPGNLLARTARSGFGTLVHIRVWTLLHQRIHTLRDNLRRLLPARCRLEDWRECFHLRLDFPHDRR